MCSRNVGLTASSVWRKYIVIDHSLTGSQTPFVAFDRVKQSSNGELLVWREVGVTKEYAYDVVKAKTSA